MNNIKQLKQQIEERRQIVLAGLEDVCRKLLGEHCAAFPEPNLQMRVFHVEASRKYNFSGERKNETFFIVGEPSAEGGGEKILKLEMLQDGKLSCSLCENRDKDEPFHDARLHRTRELAGTTVRIPKLFGEQSPIVLLFKALQLFKKKENERWELERWNENLFCSIEALIDFDVSTFFQKK